ncbi:MAG: hypothetical protein P8J33_04400 [Pirellulaceae bacterium]|nr:hypothetical protein [Pirellulaceae bacterium]
MNQHPFEPQSTKRQGVNRLAILALVLMVLVPVLYFSWFAEGDRWRAAQAMEAWLDGEKEESIQTLTEITDRLPNEHRLKLVLGEWLLEDYQAEKALDLARSIPEQFQDQRSQMLVQNCLMALDRRSEALDAYRAANPANEARDYQAELFHKNALSYFQSLAGVELPLALKNSNYVLGEISFFWNQAQALPLSVHLQGLFCTAVIYYEQIQRFQDDAEKQQMYAEKATAILSGAIAHLTEEVASWEKDLPTDAPPNSEDDAPASEGQEELADDSLNEAEAEEAQEEASQQDELTRALQVLLTLRALIYQQMQQEELSFADRRQILELGGDPETLANALPSFDECTFQLELVAMVLDTRGCVNYELNEIPAALSDLNVAVLGQEALVDVAFLTPRNGRETSLDPRQQYEEFVVNRQRTLAALLFHRSWVRRAAGNDRGAQEDLARIRQLGYVPGHYLF